MNDRYKYNINKTLWKKRCRQMTTEQDKVNHLLLFLAEWKFHFCGIYNALLFFNIVVTCGGQANFAKSLVFFLLSICSSSMSWQYFHNFFCSFRHSLMPSLWDYVQIHCLFLVFSASESHLRTKELFSCDRYCNIGSITWNLREPLNEQRKRIKKWNA